MTHWLVVGASGMLGQDMLRVLGEDGAACHGLARDQLDVTDASACNKAVAGADVVVNCAAWTDVDLAQEREASAFAVNATGAANLAHAASAMGARLVHFSTDYVFNGAATEPYPEDAPQAPVSAYGRSKAAGERAVLAAGEEHIVIRTAWLYGRGGRCFPKTIARIAHERGRVDVVADQHGQPTWTRDVAELTVRLVQARVAGGIFHATASGSASWWDFAREIVESAGLSRDVVRPVASSAMERAAPRPAFSVLGHDRFGGVGVRPIGPWADRWRVAAREVLAD